MILILLKAGKWHKIVLASSYFVDRKVNIGGFKTRLQLRFAGKVSNLKLYNT